MVMRRCCLRLLLTGVLLAGVVPHAHAQRASAPLPGAAAVTDARDALQAPYTLVAQAQAAPSAWRPLRVAKWTIGAASLGTALYGFVQNRAADDAYSELERMCQAQEEVCRQRLPGGAYADPGLEAQYQDVRRLDQRARVSLIAGQVGIATSVVLFLLDLRNEQPPPNIPYEPKGLEVGASGDGGLSVRFSLPSR